MILRNNRKQVEILHDAINSLNSEGVKQTNLGQQLDKELERLGKLKKVFILFSHRNRIWRSLRAQSLKNMNTKELKLQ